MVSTEDIRLWLLWENNMIKIKNCLVLLLSCLSLFISSTAFAGTDAAAFLKKSVGAKAIALGGAFTSVADDPTAIYWNPAGLALIQMYSVSAMGSTGASDKYPGLKDIVPTHNFFAATVPLSKFTDALGKTVVGIGYISSKMSNIQHTDDQGTVLGTINDTDSAYYLSAGLPIWESSTSLYVGASLKYITKEMSEIGVSDSGIDFDAGVIYSIDTLNFGAVLQKGVSMGDDSAPMTTKVGVSNNFEITEKLSIFPTLDVVQRQKEPLSLNFGAEFGVKKLIDGDSFAINGIYLRGGIEGYAIENRYDIKEDVNENVGYNFGLGLDFMILNTYLQLDLAICSGNLFEENTKFTINFYF